MYIDVLVELKFKKIDKTFTYQVKEDLIDKVKVGCRVLVPFNNQKLEGFILKIHNNKPDYPLKEILTLVDEEPVLNDEMLKIGLFLKKKTLANLITCYQAMLPKALKAKESYRANKKYETYLELVDYNYVPKNDKQLAIIETLKNNNTLKKEFSLSIVNNLIKKGIIKEIKSEIYRLKSNLIKEDNHVILTTDQQKVVNDVTNNLNKFYPSLLYGVTGSGKTEVYMHIIKEVINAGKEALVLVPEISLTPQLISTFQTRFGDAIAILHSHLSDGERYDEWRKIMNKEVKIVIGARSAIFAPLTNLGIIIIDEEHSQTYKQENNPRYHAVDIGLYRAKNYSIPIILGSATPSLESYARYQVGEYQLLKLENRINNNLPQVTLVDLKEEIKQNHRILSRLLIEKINDRLSKKEQVIILLNRRGYTTVLSCKKCGYVSKCPACDIPYTFHKTSNSEKCHYCGRSKAKTSKCPVCGSDDINEFGIGTQKLEEYIKNTFIHSRVIRMDTDTTSKKGSHEDIINKFKSGEYDILIGTQMISKGLDFPNVTLVGVLNGDATLNIPDFRSSERTFQLLNQVSGRAGRGNLAGEVIIQSYNIDHYSIVLASKHDYLNFYEEEMKVRKVLGYPPYYNLCLIKTMGNNFEEVMEESNKIARYLHSELKDHIILGPSSSAIPKVDNIYYMQIIIKYKKREMIIKCLEFVNDMYRDSKTINIDIDLNPVRI